MNNDEMAWLIVAAPLAIARNASELAPYIAILALGFLVGAWGQSMRSSLVTLTGIVLILLAAGAFVIEHSGGSGSGIPGIPGS
jgi:hypothetical protein